jgi:hypothetical protein
VNPEARFWWTVEPPADRLAWPPALSSLAGLPEGENLTDEVRWRLSIQECTHFFSLNVAGERLLIDGLARREKGDSLGDATGYLGHFLDEERAHTEVFRRFCQTYGGGVYPDRTLRLPRAFLPGEEELLFYAQVLLFEEVSHHVNVLVAQADVWPLVRAINAYHAEEESRHVAFGRLVVQRWWEVYAPAWGEGGQAQVMAYLLRYLASVWRNTINPDAFRDAAVPGDPFALRQAALASRAHQDAGDAAMRNVRRFLSTLGASFDGQGATAPPVGQAP